MSWDIRMIDTGYWILDIDAGLLKNVDCRLTTDSFVSLKFAIHKFKNHEKTCFHFWSSIINDCM